MCVLPKDAPNSSRAICDRGRALVHYRFNSEHWVYREVTGNDIGIDCELEYVENDEYNGDIISCQIKATKNIEKYKIKDNQYSFPLDKKTINYALRSSRPFILCLVDVICEKVYYMPIQDYFMNNFSLFEKLESGDGTVNVHVCMKNEVTNEDSDLIEISKQGYIGSGRNLQMGRR